MRPVEGHIMDNWELALRQGLADFIDFLPKLLLAIIIFVVGYFIALALSKALSALLERVGFDRAIERGGVKRALASSKLDASDIVAKIVFYTLLLFVLQFAFGVFGPNPVSDLLEGIISYLPRIVVAIVIIIIAAAIAAGVKSIIENTLGGLSYGRLVANIASIFILFLGITAALSQVQIATAVTQPLLIAVLAIIAGVIIVGAGGGLIKPMQARWEAYLTRAEIEAPRIKAQTQQAPPMAEQVQQAKQRVSSGARSTTATGTRTTAMPVVDDETEVIRDPNVRR